jgi:hypothetical protein
MKLADKYALNIYKPLQYKTSGKTLTLADKEEVIAQEFSGSLDFNGFPQLVRYLNGDIDIFYSHGAGHGATPIEGSGVYSKRSTDKGLTWSTRVKRYDTLTRPLELSNVMPDVGLNDRLILFPYDPDAFTGARVPYISYTDKEWTEFATPVKISDDYDGDGRQADGTGRHLVVGTKIYKSLYGRTESSGNRYMQLYVSEDNGESAQLIIRTPVPAGKDFEEIQLGRYSDGLWIALVRTDTDKILHAMYGYAPDKWSPPFPLGYLSYGRPSFAISPAGTLLVLGRHGSGDDDDGRPNFMWTADRGKTINTDFISERTTFQTYGDVMYVGSVPGVGSSCFLAVWSEDENFPNGPARVYRNYFVES